MTGTIEDIKRSVEARLAALTPLEASCGGRLAEAMRYSLMAPAKRVRGILTVLAAEHCGVDGENALDIAASIEMVHAASLILDDLPAMDDASMRRGRPTNHREFGEDIAILAAISLMNLGYQVVAADQRLTADQRARLATALARGIGTEGLTGGQTLDLAADRQAGTVETVERTHALKTGALFVAAAHSGAIVADAGPGAERAMIAFGSSLGLAFQAFDDLLDAHATAAAIGKDVARDTGKATVVDLLGRAGAEARARAHAANALDALEHKSLGTRTPSRLEGYVGGLLDQLAAPLAAIR
jgi:geranylgeranyl diphosphate synthase type II